MSSITQMPYGAYELKSVYQKNMLAGIAVSVSVIILIMFLSWLYTVLTYTSPVAPPLVPPQIHIDLGPRIKVDPTRPKGGSGKVRKPKLSNNVKIGVLVAVPEAGIEEDGGNKLPTNEEIEGILRNLCASGTNTGQGDTFFGGSRGREVIPPPDSLIPVEEMPVQIYEEMPKYPKLAMEGGFTGYVIVQVYVDKNGIVKKARAVKTNRPNIGFEEAAIQAAYKCKYRPAIQNYIPVGCWIAYKVKFEL